jgi:hypothetical protein
MLDYRLDTASGVCVERGSKERKCNKGQWRNESGICVAQCQYGFKIVSRNPNTTNTSGFTINCSRYCKSNHGMGIYSTIEADTNNTTGSSLLCVKEQKNQTGHKLFMTATIYKLSQEYTMFVLTPLQSGFVYSNGNSFNLTTLLQFYKTVANTTVSNPINKSYNYIDNQYSLINLSDTN